MTVLPGESAGQSRDLMTRFWYWIVTVIKRLIREANYSAD
jgi:hypothetical protein